jgi:hypothetical protein
MLRSIGLFFLSMPFLFGLLRAVTTRNDLRYLWVAAASLVGAAAFTAVTPAPSRRRRIVLSIGAFIVATFCATAAAMLLATRFGPGLLVVAASFGFCAAAGCALFAITGYSGVERGPGRNHPSRRR